MLYWYLFCDLSELFQIPTFCHLVSAIYFCLFHPLNIFVFKFLNTLFCSINILCKERIIVQYIFYIFIAYQNRDRITNNVREQIFPLLVILGNLSFEILKVLADKFRLSKSNYYFFSAFRCYPYLDMK